MFERNPWRETVAGVRGQPPTFVVVLLVGLALGLIGESFVELRPLLALCRLDARIWEAGQLWRIVTFGLVGEGGLSLWSAVELVIIYWFVVELCVTIGVARARVLLFGGIAVAGTAAVVVQLAWELTGGERSHHAFWMIQGQRVVMAIIVPAFATRHRYTTLRMPLLFDLPIPSRWVIGVQLVIALLTWAGLRDTGGLAGVLAATLWGATAMRSRRWSL